METMSRQPRARPRVGAEPVRISSSELRAKTIAGAEKRPAQSHAVDGSRSSPSQLQSETWYTSKHAVSNYSQQARSSARADQIRSPEGFGVGALLQQVAR